MDHGCQMGIRRKFFGYKRSSSTFASIEVSPQQYSNLHRGTEETHFPFLYLIFQAFAQ